MRLDPPLASLLLEDLVAELDALVADMHARARDELSDPALAPSTKGAPSLVRWPSPPFQDHLRQVPHRGLPELSATDLLVILYDVVNDAVLDGLVRAHYVVSVGVALDPLVGLTRVLREDLVQAPLGHYELLGVDLHVRSLSCEATNARLVQENPRVRQRVPLALGAGREQKRPHRRRHPQGRRDDVRLDELHGVVDRESGRDAAARGVYVEVDVLLWVLALQVEKLGHDGVGHLVVNRGAKEDDAVFQEPRVDVHRALPARALLYYVGDHGLRIVVVHRLFLSFFVFRRAAPGLDLRLGRGLATRRVVVFILGHRGRHGALDQEIEGFGPRYLLLQEHVGAVLAHGFGDLLRIPVRTFCEVSDLVHDLILVGLYALGRRDRVEGKLLFDRVCGVGSHPVLEVFFGGSGELVVLPRLHPLRPEAPLEASQHLLYLLVNHDVGDLDIGLLRRGVEHACAELALDAPLLGGLELLPNGGAQLIEGLELARLLGELVVEGWELALLDLLKMHPEEDRLAPQGLLGIVQREGYPELLALAGLHADELTFEVRQELTAADLQHVVLGLGPLQRSAGHPLAPEVYNREVALTNGTVLHRREGGELAAHLLELLLDLLVGHLDLFLWHIEALVLPELRLGTDGDGGGELEAPPLVERLVEVDLWSVYRPQVRLEDRLGVPG